MCKWAKYSAKLIKPTIVTSWISSPLCHVYSPEASKG